jgi:CSLREA domain-containing protein
LCPTAARLLAILTVLTLVFSISPPVTAAATWTVTKTADTNDGACDSDCSLREAIAAAASGDTIVFDASLSGGTITLGTTLTLSKNVTIDGSALAVPITIDGANTYRVFYVNSGVAATLSGLTIAHGYTSGNGGGIYNQGMLTVMSSTISANRTSGGGRYGGGIFNAGSSTLIVRSSTFMGNRTDDRGGAIYNAAGTLTVADSTFTGNIAGYGAGVYSWVATATLNNSTFSGNSALSMGGVYNNWGGMTVSNCTFSGNSATGTGNGQGIGGGFVSDGRATVLNSTFSGNSAAAAGGGFFYSKTYTFSTLTLINTVIANSPAGGDCYTIAGAINTNLNNLVEDGSCSANGINFKTGDPQLGPLADNGGPTWTFALLSGSPALDAGDNATCAAPPVSGKDQRGEPRNDGQCDIGAFELNNQPPVAEANGPYTVAEGDSMRLDGTASYDPDVGDTLTCAWDLDNDGVYETAGATPDFSGLDGPASHAVTLQVCDQQAACGTDAATVEVTNVAPTAEAGDDATVYRNGSLSLSGSWTDPAAALDEAYAWTWDLDGDGDADASGSAAYGETASATATFAAEGDYDLTFTVTDADGDSGQDTVRITVLDHAPDCSGAAASPALLWPPNNKFVRVAIGGVTDADGDPVALAITRIRQDEPVGKGNSAPDGKGVGTATAELRAEKLGNGDGRVYHVYFTAGDGHGGACTGEVRVSVPHDQARPAVDGGPLYDSTVPTP